MGDFLGTETACEAKQGKRPFQKRVLMQNLKCSHWLGVGPPRVPLCRASLTPHPHPPCAPQEEKGEQLLRASFWKNKNYGE